MSVQVPATPKASPLRLCQQAVNLYNMELCFILMGPGPAGTTVHQSMSGWPAPPPLQRWRP
jgi:hypothetical protein